MSDKPNIFADVETVGQLFDALWFQAQSATLAEGVAAAKEDRPWEVGFVRQRREQAITDAVNRYNELKA